MNDQRINIGSDWGVRINGGCIDMIGSAARFDNGAHRLAFGNNPGAGPTGPTGPITGHQREKIEGGYAEIEATFYSNSGRLSARTMAVGGRIDSVHIAGFIVGLDRQGRPLFSTKSFDIPTACSSIDLTCRTTNAIGSFEDQINPIVARYVTRLEVHVTSRGDSFWRRVSNTIREGVQTYNDLPPEVKAAIAAAAAG